MKKVENVGSRHGKDEGELTLETERLTLHPGHPC